MNHHRRGPWSQTEDSHLMQLVAQNGPLNWVTIAQVIGSRSPKQCRERYHQNLKPTLVHEPITAEEGAHIEYLVETLGKKWADIARRLPGRSDNAVKNWYNGSMNRRRRLEVQRKKAARPEHHQGAAEMEPQVYARRSHQPLTITSQSLFGSHRYISSPQLSPAQSEASRPDSVGAPPSLVSDSCNSPYSRAQQSPMVELPPLAMPAPGGRRPSLPTLHLSAPPFHETEAHSYGHQPRYAPEPKCARREHFHPYARPERPYEHHRRQETSDPRYESSVPCNFPPRRPASYESPARNDYYQSPPRPERLITSYQGVYTRDDRGYERVEARPVSSYQERPREPAYAPYRAPEVEYRAAYVEPRPMALAYGSEVYQPSQPRQVEAPRPSTSEKQMDRGMARMDIKSLLA